MKTTIFLVGHPKKIYDLITGKVLNSFFINSLKFTTYPFAIIAMLLYVAALAKQQPNDNWLLVAISGFAFLG